MAGVEHQHHVARLDPAFEFVYRPRHRLAADILRRDDVKAELAQALRNRARIVPGLFQRCDVLVSVVADDEREAVALGKGWLGEQHTCKGQQQKPETGQCQLSSDRTAMTKRRQNGNRKGLLRNNCNTLNGPRPHAACVSLPQK